MNRITNSRGCGTGVDGYSPRTRDFSLPPEQRIDPRTPFQKAADAGLAEYNRVQKLLRDAEEEKAEEQRQRQLAEQKRVETERKRAEITQRRNEYFAKESLVEGAFDQHGLTEPERCVIRNQMFEAGKEFDLELARYLAAETAARKKQS